MKKLQIFISSPGDVFEERAIAQRVIERMQSEYAGRAVLQPVLWEHEPLLASSTFQEQIVKPSETDVVVSILWSRLGTRLPKGFTRGDGSRYDSGTEYEFEDALEAYRRNGKPELLVYRKTAPPSVRLDDEKELLERLQQKKKLDEFVQRWFHDTTEGTLKAAFHAFDSPSDFENLLEAHLHKLIDRKLPDTLAASDAVPAVWKKGSPFRGLHAFEFEHAPVFFGRTKAVSDILQALRDQAAEGRPFVLILGMSGGGKSSVVRAGVLPMLTQPGVIEGVALWRRAIFRPGDTPGDLFTGLASAILREHGLPSLDAGTEGPVQLAQVLRESPQSAVMLIKSALDQAAAQQSKDGKKVESRLALVIDQMEEMFTQDGVTAKDRKAFANTLDALAGCGRVWIIGTLRSDFYPRLVDLPVIGELKEGDGQYDLMPPVASEIGQMIRLPTRAAGLRFEEDPASSERLDDMLRDAAAERPEILPLLQFTLEELYQRRTPTGMLTISAYRELGGVEGSLAQRAETVFQELAPEVQAALPKVLNALVSIEQDGHETIGRKRAPWKDVIHPEVRRLLETFVAARLFVTELGAGGDAVVTVAHEALLWHWPRVQEWVNQNRENLRIRGRIAVAAERWRQEERPSDLLLPRGKPLGEAETLLHHDIDLSETESAFIGASIARSRRNQRLRGAVVMMLGLLAVLAGGAAFLAGEQRNRAVEAQSRAEVEAETARRTTEFMVDLFEVSDPSEARGNSITAREVLERGFARIEAELSAQPEIQSTLMSAIGAVYTSLGLYDQAAPFLQSALATLLSVHGDKHLEVARTYHRLGEVLMLRADYSAANEAFSKALATRQELLGEKHLDVAASLVGLAEVLTHQGEFEKAEPLLRQSLEIRTELLGEEDLEVARSLELLGLNLFDQGDLDGAEPYLRQAIDIRKRLTKGIPLPDLANGLNDLGYLLYNKGELEETETLWREALTMNRQLLDEGHPDIAANLSNLALVSHDKGNYNAAESLYREALEMRRHALGEEHPDIASTLNNLAFLLHDKGDAQAAIEMEIAVVAMYRNFFPNGHPALARALATLGSWLTREGRFADAEPLLDESLEMRRTSLGNEHPEVAGGMTSLAHLYLLTGRAEEARKLASEARSMFVELLPPGHWRTAWTAAIEGASLGQLDQFEAAEELLLESYDTLRQTPAGGSRAGYVEETRAFLVALYQAWGKPVEAAKHANGTIAAN